MQTTVRRAGDRGRADYGWLDTRHTFSFANYFDPEHMGFSHLRVLNDDRVAPGSGFPPHPHRDMEILTYVVEGALEHQDSMGNGSIVGPGGIQYMSAGTGVFHSEYNASDSEPLRFLQIWILPESRGGQPRYGQQEFPEDERTDRFRLVASRDGRDGSIPIRQDAAVYASVLSAGAEAAHEVASGRRAWLQVVAGMVGVDGLTLSEGDGLAVAEPGHLVVRAHEPAEVLCFDLA